MVNKERKEITQKHWIKLIRMPGLLVKNCVVLVSLENQALSLS